VYQSASQDYYEPMGDWEVEENTNINVLKETKENYPRPYKYAEAQVNVWRMYHSHTHVKEIHSLIKQGT
jgi:hypothetical protein